MSDIFLSFSGKKSEEFAVELEKLITKIGIGTTFLANNNIHSGDDWLKKIYDNLKECRIGIVIFTEDNRDNNKWLYLEYGVLSYKVITQPTDKLKVIPLFLDFKQDDWTKNPLQTHQSISFVEDLEKSISKLLSDINHITNKKFLTFSEEILKNTYTPYIKSLKNILDKPNNTTTQSEQLNNQQLISNQNNNITLANEKMANLLLKINNFINQNQCILFNYIEYDKLEKYLEEITSDDSSLASAIANLSSSRYLIFKEERAIDNYPIEYVSLSIQGHKVIRRRKRNN